MPTIAEQNRQDTELMYQLLSEGKLDLMYLPAGAIAWLWDRPLPQMEAARDLAVAAKDICPVTDAAVLRSDQNVLVLKCEDGHKFNVYPQGGYGCDGQPLDIHGCMELLDQGMQPVPQEECPMEGGGAPEPGVEFMTYDRLADEAAAADPGPTPSSIGENMGGYTVDDPKFVQKAARYLARDPAKNLKDVKDSMSLFMDHEEDKVANAAQKYWLQFSKAMHDGDYIQAARAWQDYFHAAFGGGSTYLMAGQMDEAREISLKELTYDELRNWFRRMRDQLSPPQVKGIKKLLIQKRMDELGGDGGFSGQIRQWQPVGEDEGSPLEKPDYVKKGARDLAANPDAALQAVKDLMQQSLARLQSSGSDDEMAWGNIPPDPKKAHWPKKIQSLWLEFSKAMHDEDYQRAARAFQDYYMLSKEDEGMLLADVGGEEKEDSFQRDREDEMVDVICKTRSSRNMPDFMKQMKADESNGAMTPGTTTGRDFDDEDILNQIGYAARQARGVGEKAEVVLELLRTSPKSVVNNWRRAGSPYPNTPQFMEYLKNYIGISDEDIARLEQEDREYKAKIRGKREDVGDRGGTPIGTDVFDFEDDLPQIEMMVGEELKKYQDN